MRLPICAVILLLILAGCSKPTAVALAPVRGQVLFQGRPLAGGLVVFTPDRERGPSAKPFAAKLDADGRYELAAAPPVAPKAPPGVSQGVPPGWYAVAFADAPQSGAIGFPAELRRPDLSGVLREVIAGRDNVIDFNITATE